MKTFSMLCTGLYEPLLEKRWEKLNSCTEEITTKYASRGFPNPPGAMYAEIVKCYKADMPARADVIFDSCCQAYRASTPKPSAEEFSNEIHEAITREQNQILASWEAHFSQLNAQFRIPAFQTFLDRYRSELFSEGRRLLRYYSSKAIAFLGESTAAVTLGQSNNNTPHHWYQRPIGNIGITIISGVFVVFVVYLIKQYLGLAL